MSFRFDRIVAATDFSDNAAEAARRAASIAAAHGVELELLHVVCRASLDLVRWFRTPANLADRLVEDAQRLLKEFAASLGSRALIRVVVGDVLDEILSNCAGRRMLAVGARGLSPLRDAILGTTAERLAGKCECPLLVVRKPAQESYRSVLVAVDLQPDSQAALSMAAEMASSARITAVHAYDVPFEGTLQRAGVPMQDIEQHRAAAFQEALQSLRTLSETVTGDPSRVLPVVDRGYPARLVLEHQRGISADLVVMGKRRRSAAESLILGSTTRHVLADAGCDVLVVPLGR